MWASTESGIAGPPDCSARMTPRWCRGTDVPLHPVPSMYWATRSRARASLLMSVPWRMRSVRAASLYASPSTSTATIASRCSVDSSRMPS